jgi:hypothetical protein
MVDLTLPIFINIVLAIIILGILEYFCYIYMWMLYKKGNDLTKMSYH